MLEGVLLAVAEVAGCSAAGCRHAVEQTMTVVLWSEPKCLLHDETYELLERRGAPMSIQRSTSLLKGKQSGRELI